ncbi:hypothetical protein ASE79_08380 [Sphingomonas sp. Leaf28]|nr:hypothetical protein ASE79_08380 [Sphingomonas sp. Leaf28]
MMAAKIATHTSSGITDWKTASDDYFRWRWVDAGNSAETFPGEGGRPAPIAPAPNFGEWRHNAETALRQRLIDPSSAQFTWPFGFVNGYWKPLLQKRITGWVTCGQVNAKNRMGGFTGSTTFVVVINDGRTTFTDMDSGTNRYGLVAAGCEKFSASLPEPQPGMLEDTSMPASAQGRSSIADELTKLAALRDRGILTESEFQSQKATLLSK